MKKFDVKKFSAESPELYKAFKDYADHRLSEMGVQGKQFSAKSLDDKEKVINKLFADEVERRSKIEPSRYDGDMMHYAHDPLVKSFADAIYDKMIDMIIPDVLNSTVGLISEITNVDWGDVAKFTLKNGALYNVARAGYRQKNTLLQQLEDTDVTVAPEAHEVTTTATLFEMLTDRKSIANETFKAVLSMRAEIEAEAWDAFETAVNASTVPTALKVTNYSQDSAIKLADIVTAYNGGNKAKFVGTPTALRHIVPADGHYEYPLDDRFVTEGYIGKIMGYQLMGAKNFADYKSSDYALKLKDDVVYVVSGNVDKPIKIAVGGALTFTEDARNNANLRGVMTTMKSWKAICATNAVAGSISL